MDYSKIDMQKIHTKRHLELAVVNVDGDHVTFRIAEQTHRGEEFTPDGNGFRSSSGCVLSSNNHPQYGSSLSILFVRGYDSAEDDNKITVSLHNFAGIMQAISEYNETNGAGYEKPWPQDGSGYYCINDRVNIGYYIYSPDFIDEEHRKSGNFFRTREEAEAALERVKKALKGIDENKLLREALEEAIAMYGKPGGPWNVPGDAGGWLDRARKALEVGNE